MLIARYNRTYQRSQTLRCHAENTAQKTSETLESMGLKHTGLLVGWLHDMGKGLPSWQKSLAGARERYFTGDQTYHPLDVSHAPPSAQFIHTLLKDKAASIHDKACLQVVCLSVYAHHGYLMDALTLEGEDYFTRQVCSKQSATIEDFRTFFQEVIPIESIFSLFSSACIEIKSAFSKLPSAINHYPRSDQKEKTDQSRALHFLTSFIVRTVYAALIDADRLDAANFESCILFPQKERELPDWGMMIDSLNNRLASFKQDSHINRVRHIISEQCAKAATWNDKVLALHAPTGGGKTLSSLRWALLRANIKRKKRIFYIVTYTTILDQVYDEYKKVLKHCNVTVDLLLHHSNIIPDEPADYKPLSNRQEYIEEKQSQLTERWDADIILTSQVQFFNALFLGTSKAARRLRGLNDSVIIFDEVQTVSPQLSHIFNLAVNFLTSICGCEVLLSSATQPPFERMSFPLPPVRNIFDNPDTLFGDMRRVELIDERNNVALSAKEIASFCIRKQKDWESCLVILNTRSAARKVYDELQQMAAENLPLYFLSNDLCPAHRKEIIQSLFESESPCICVSTQLIECGVDLSFGCVIRSLAGADNIWQAAGRCNRHDDGRIHPVYIIQCAEENLTHLQDIRLAQDACNQTLHYLDSADAMQKPSAMSDYFSKYFHNQQNQLSFPVTNNGKKSTLVNLLSNNPTGREAYWENNPGKEQTWPLSQAFGTAGKCFTVIDSPTISLIVPYKEGGEIISDLNGKIFPEQERALLRKAQLYSINIYRHRLNYLLEQEAAFLLPCGAFALLPEWYDSHKRGLLDTPVYDISKSFV